MYACIPRSIQKCLSPALLISKFRHIRMSNSIYQLINKINTTIIRRYNHEEKFKLNYQL